MGKIAVLGTGPSWELCNPLDYDLTIGVNDIWRYLHTDIIVCINPRKDFTPERLNIIDNSKPKAFYSQIVNWDSRDDFKKLNFVSYYPNTICPLDIQDYQKSYTSTFVACQVAFKEFGATEIHLFGADMTNHPFLNGDLCNKIKVHFVNLAAELRKAGCDFVVHGDGILKNI